MAALITGIRLEGCYDIITLAYEKYAHKVHLLRIGLYRMLELNYSGFVDTHEQDRSIPCRKYVQATRFPRAWALQRPVYVHLLHPVSPLKH